MALVLTLAACSPAPAATKSPFATERCAREEPELVELKPNHFVSCHRASELNLEGVGGARRAYEATLSQGETA